MPPFLLTYYYKYSTENSKSRTKQLVPCSAFTNLYLLSRILNMYRFVKNFFIGFDALAAANHAQIFVV